MKTAIITFSARGATVAAMLGPRLGDCTVYVHADVAKTQAGSVRSAKTRTSRGGSSQTKQSEFLGSVHRFDHIRDLTGELFASYRNLVFIAPTGLVVRAIAPHLRHKTADPAVVVVDVGGRWAISLLSGHEGGANDLAVAVGNILAAEPIITTTTEAAKTIIVGVGCRRGVAAERIVDAVNQSLARANLTISQVRLLASADIKADEAGLIEAAARLGVPLRLISSDEIRACRRDFARSEFVQAKVNLPAVAEPAALLAGRRTQLLLPKQTFPGVTVAVAEELPAASCLSSA